MGTVIADDGVRLHVEVDGDRGAEVTFVLCHGYTLTSETWRFQRMALRRVGRLVVWDQRGHGRSARGRAEHATVDQVGRDTYAVLEQTAPTGPVVLVGHSMGAMGILALAQAHPELFGPGGRVAAVALISTSAGPVTGVPWLPGCVAETVHRLASCGLSALCRLPISAVRHSAPARLLTRFLAARYAFASPVPRPVAALLAEMIDSTPIEVIENFFPGFRNHNLFAALPVLGQVDCLILTGAVDALTPLACSEEIASAVPGARLVVVPDAGHVLPLEHPHVVTHALTNLLRERLVADTA